eukprot:13533-Amphidinium_carterae.1
MIPIIEVYYWSHLGRNQTLTLHQGMDEIIAIEQIGRVRPRERLTLQQLAGRLQTQPCQKTCVQIFLLILRCHPNFIPKKGVSDIRKTMRKPEPRCYLAQAKKGASGSSGTS